MEEEAEAKSAGVSKCHDEPLLALRISPMSPGSFYFPPAGFQGTQASSTLPSLTGSKGSIFMKILVGSGALPGESNLYPVVSTSESS